MVSAASRQRDVDAGLAVDGLGDRIADRLDEAVDQRASRMPEPAAELMRPPGMKPSSSALRKRGSQRRGVGLDRGQRARDAAAHGAGHVGAVEVALGAFGVLLAQDVEADLLPGKARLCRRGGAGRACSSRGLGLLGGRLDGAGEA